MFVRISATWATLLSLAHFSAVVYLSTASVATSYLPPGRGYPISFSTDSYGQVLGASNSAYSLAGQLRLNPTFSAPGGHEATMVDVEALMTRLRDEYGLLSICDIVLNHTANETPWLAGKKNRFDSVRMAF